MTSSDTPLQFAVANGDVFTFTLGDMFGAMYPSPDKIGLDEWVWRLSRTVIRRPRDAAGELLEVRAETVIISEGYATTAAEAAYDMRACLHRQLAMTGQTEL
ncbi:hypothetical protein [Paraburkholderia sp. MM6662-R1]|uniref:hypothetical protein n=1 Tax=Paraburkholderia sp. MM6662-R1 TaxID=2991066 RepID=UPI003D21DEAF